MWSGNLAVEHREDFAEEEEHVDQNGVGDDLGQGLDLLLARIKLGVLSDQQAQKNQQRRAGGKGRGQKAGGHDGGEPVAPAGQTGVQKGRHGVDAGRPREWTA